MNPNIIDALLQRFEAATQAGYVNVGGATISLLWMLAGIALALAVVWNMFGGKTPWMALFSKFLLIGFFAWLVEAWPDVVKQIQETFIQVGLMAGDSSMAAVDFAKPSNISVLGEEVASVLFKRADEVTFSFSLTSGFSGKIAEWFAFWLAGWFVQFAYWLTALMILASQVVFYVSSVLALFMTAFMVFTGTAWIGRGALGWLVSAGTMLMTLAAITSIMMPIFNGIAFDTVDQYAANQAVLGSLVMMALVIGAGSISRGIGNGVASWGMGSAMGVASSAAVTAVAATAGAAMIAGPAARAVASQMAASRAASAVGPKITMNAPASYASAGKIEDMSLKGRMASAAGKASFSAQPASAPAASSAGGTQASSRAIRQLERAGQVSMPSAISSIMIARAAVPEIADEGPSMNPSNVG